MKAICDKQLLYSAGSDVENEGGANPVVLVEALPISPGAVPDSYSQEEQFGGLPTIPHLTEAELAEKQRNDACMKHIIHQIEHGDTAPPTLRKQLLDLPLFLR